MKSENPGVQSDSPIVLKLEKIGDVLFPWKDGDSLGEPVFLNLNRSHARVIAAQILGSLTSSDKVKAARENGKKGGRPRSKIVKSVADIRAEKEAKKADRLATKERRAAVKNPKTALPLFPSDGLPVATPVHPSHSAAPPKKGALGGKRGRPKQSNPADGLDSAT